MGFVGFEEGGKSWQCKVPSFNDHPNYEGFLDNAKNLTFSPFNKENTKIFRTSIIIEENFFSVSLLEYASFLRNPEYSLYTDREQEGNIMIRGDNGVFCCAPLKYQIRTGVTI